MATKLVIVESPSKVKNISSYLGEGFVVDASVGHIRDLPNPSELPADMKKGPYGKFAVNVDDGFDPYYVVDADKRKKVTELKRLLKDADELYLATDEDREGEAIAWHLLQVLKPKVPVKRMVFNEITKEAIQRAVANTRELDDRLVDAQETRRILDRLYGYEVSPVLWRKVRQGLSAGRVQSVATRMVVERERERMAFRAASYWDIDGEFAAGSGNAFTARLSALDGTRVATGRDFDDLGRLTTSSVVHLDSQRATALAEAVKASDARVTSVQEKPYTRRPSAPFTTSTLQQEASRKLRLSSKNAMRVAQRLYENGYITYMRTDSVTLSSAATSAARQQARDLYGAEYVPDKPRVYAGKAKNAQEAHEAIRPAGDRFRTPAQVAGELRGDEFALYELIWKRTVASQMADARGSTATVRLEVPVDAAGAKVAEFSASGTVITFRGFLAAYEEGRDAVRNADDSTAERRLPKLSEGVELDVLDAEAKGHETSPPPRYTEATLVKAMEEKGIGRPSTYAATVGTIQDRGYVQNRGSALVPTWLAFAVTQLLEQHFPSLVDYDFTASMEEGLDQIAAGDEDRVAWLTRFYFGDQAKTAEGLREMVDDLGEIDARGISTIPIGEDIVVRVGRYGPYVEALQVDTSTGEVTGDPKRASITDDIAPDEMTPEKARELLAAADDDGRVLGTDPESGHEIVAKAGRYGPYVTEVLPQTEDAAPKKGKKAAGPKPRTASLFKDMDLSSIDLATALRLLSLPRVVGEVTEGEGEDAKTVQITAQNGRYGPYLKKGSDSRSLQTEQQIFDITLPEALAIYAEPKRRGAAAKPPLKELGQDPVSGKPVVVKDGRFGPYVTDGETNATLRKGDEPETITPERGFELLAEKRAKGPTTRKRAAKKTAKKTAKKAAKKTASRAAKK
ncbi:type I DNA topoisomerase [Calidifontibacter sp. DB0510]|uniref:DNA topoisomerase 1 n=1 Tax=Metallococcus carri TaxID=1656884 RepID=A0A967B4C4_9MICO|nr:type I DNA topoisomerase [Metallococcus carri]NHN55392.1 type I DNA topoisomerase [Metallococcus carri]NOP36469.1 type I DNA topoisomerase [Calidifontibacter sp. DB2511S]